MAAMNPLETTLKAFRDLTTTLDTRNEHADQEGNFQQDADSLKTLMSHYCKLAELCATCEFRQS